MKLLNFVLGFTFLIPVILPSSVLAANTAVPDADIVYLKKNCGTLNNCFDNSGSLNTWIWGTRNPTATSRLLVEIGPGTFGGFSCNNSGYVTLRGSGRGITIISGSGLGTISVSNCEKLEFESLTVTGFYAVFWRGTGSSTWSGVDIISSTYGWYDEGCGSPKGGGGPPTALHYWFGSRITTTGGSGPSTPYFSQCGDNWFYGGELSAMATDEPGSIQTQVAVAMYFRGQMRIFGSVVRAVANKNGTTSYSPPVPASRTANGLVGISAFGGGTVHMHGGIVNADGSTVNSAQDISVAAIFSDGASSLVHTPGTSFIVRANGAGTAYRIIGNGTTNAPFTWPSGSNPPAIVSIPGSDIFVETDCGVSGNCNGGGIQPHMMIYSPDECGADNPWFNMRTNSCRQP